MEQKNPKEKILKKLLKDFTTTHTLSAMAQEIEMTRSGTWKALKKLEKEHFIKLEPIGNGKTSAYKISLDWNNPLLEKTLALLLAKEALKQDKWRYFF